MQKEPLRSGAIYTGDISSVHNARSQRDRGFRMYRFCGQVPCVLGCRNLCLRNADLSTRSTRRGDTVNRNRLIAVGVLVLVLLAIFWPRFLVGLIQRPIYIILAAVQPFIPLILLCLIIFLVLTRMIGAIFGGGRRGGRR